MPESIVGHTFNDLRSFLAWLETPLANGQPASSGYSHQTEPSANYFHTPDFDTALSLVRSGWTDGREAIEALRAELADRIQGSIALPEIRFDYEGDYVDVDRYVQGEPECWASLDESPERLDIQVAMPRIVHVVISISAAWMVKPSTFLQRGAAAIAVIDLLESRRIRCIVDLQSSANPIETGERYLLNVRLKEADEPISVDTFAFLLAHPSALRRFVWSAREHLPTDVAKRQNPGYGTYGDKASYPQGDIYLGCVRHDWDTAATWQWITKTLNDQGIAIS